MWYFSPTFLHSYYFIWSCNFSYVVDWNLELNFFSLGWILWENTWGKQIYCGWKTFETGEEKLLHGNIWIYCRGAKTEEGIKWVLWRYWKGGITFKSFRYLVWWLVPEKKQVTHPSASSTRPGWFIWTEPKQVNCQKGILVISGVNYGK